MAGMAPIQYQWVARIPYWYAAPAQPISSSEPRFADRKLRPAIQAVISRPARKKSSPVWVCHFRYQPIPSTMAKYATMITMSGRLSESSFVVTVSAASTSGRLGIAGVPHQAVWDDGRVGLRPK